jgi:hypothetical protein
MSSKALWNPIRNPDMSSFSRTLSLWLDFDDLHFTNSPNASPLIVQSSKDSKKNKNSIILKDLHDFSLFLHHRLPEAFSDPRGQGYPGLESMRIDASDPPPTLEGLERPASGILHQ